MSQIESYSRILTASPPRSDNPSRFWTEVSLFLWTFRVWNSSLSLALNGAVPYHSRRLSRRLKEFPNGKPPRFIRDSGSARVGESPRCYFGLARRSPTAVTQCDSHSMLVTRDPRICSSLYSFMLSRLYKADLRNI